MLGRCGAFVDIFFAVHFEAHGTPAVGASERTGSDILGHIHGGAFVMVAHKVHNLFNINLVIGFDPQGHALGVDIAHSVFLVFRHTGVDATEHGIYSCVAGADATESKRRVGVGEAKVGVGAVIPAAGACEGDHIRAVNAFHFGFENIVDMCAADGAVKTFTFGFVEFLGFLGELGDACLVGVTAHISVGNAAGHPYGAVGVFVFQLLAPWQGWGVCL